MRPNSPWGYAILTVRVVLGLWFLVLGIEKAFFVGAVAFSRKVEDFEILVGGWNLLVAYLVPWVEIIMGLCLLGGWLRRGASRVALGLTLVFVVVSVQAWKFGMSEDCGCFGSWMVLSHVQKMVLLTVQTIAVVFVIATERSLVRRVFRGSRMRLN